MSLLCVFPKYDEAIIAFAYHIKNLRHVFTGFQCDQHTVRPDILGHLGSSLLGGPRVAKITAVGRVLIMVHIGVLTLRYWREIVS